MSVIDDVLAPEDIHELAHETLQSGVSFILASAVVLLVEVCMLYAVLFLGLPAILGFFIHVITCGAAYLYFKTLVKSHNDARFALLLTITTATLGPFGAFGSLLSFMMTQFYIKHAQKFMDWFASIFPKLHLRKAEEIYEEIVLGRDVTSRDYQVIPFTDVMRVGNEQQKRTALTKMTQLFHPRFAPAFQMALADSSNTIRVQAATSVNRIESQFLERSMKLNALAKKHPNNAKILLAKAMHYDDYAFTGILDPELEQQNRTTALASYHEYLKQKPEDANVRLYVGRLLMRSGKLDNAARHFEETLEKNIISQPIIVWYMECLFRQGNFKKLRSVAGAHRQTLEGYDTDKHSISEALRVWMQDFRILLAERTANANKAVDEITKNNETEAAHA